MITKNNSTIDDEHDERDIKMVALRDVAQDGNDLNERILFRGQIIRFVGVKNRESDIAWSAAYELSLVFQRVSDHKIFCWAIDSPKFRGHRAKDDCRFFNDNFLFLSGSYDLLGILAYEYYLSCLCRVDMQNYRNHPRKMYKK